MRFRHHATASRRASLTAVVLALALITGLDGCSKISRKVRAKHSFGTTEKVLNVKMADLQPAIAANIQGADRPAWVTEPRWNEVRKLYARFGNAPLWLEEGGVNERAKALIAALRAAPDHALDTSAYPIAQIEQLLNTKLLKDSASASSIAQADVMLTSAYVAYAADMLSGQVDPTTVSQSWHIRTPKAELDSALVRSLEDSDMTYSLAQMAPQDQDYAALKAAYARYRDIEAKGGWPQVPAGAAGAARDAALHARLDAEISADSIGNVPGADTSSVSYAPLPPADKATAPEPGVHGTPQALRAELMKFQERHGLERTGKLDQPTIDALNVTVAERARQIGANMERHRWLPRTLGSRYVYVNVPAYRLDAYDSGQRTLTMRTVVGSEYQGKNTPVFSDSMETVVFRPYWNITPEIQAKEIGPKAASDPGYLERNNMEYYKDGGETRIRQRPGGKNSLGLVKFLFPNDFNIYLHDTPAKELFQKTERAASHGCIRLEKPAELAQWVLGWDAGRVQEAMNNGPDNHAVKIPRKIPVYIVYFTTYLRDGRLFFGDDIYNRDNALVKKIADAPATPNAKPATSSGAKAGPAAAPARGR